MSATRGGAVLHARIAAAHAPAAAATDVPEQVLQALCRYCLLERIPLAYLLPDPGLLPDESIRFFTVDPAWTDALAAGVLAVSAAGNSGQAFVARHLAGTIAAVRARLAAGTIKLSSTQANVPSPSTAGPVPITGFLLRSALVSAYPQLEVRAFAADSNGRPPRGDGDPADPQIAALQLPTLRLQRLTPNVLVALFSGLPAAIWIEEPHHGLRLGIEPADAQQPQPYVTTPDNIAVTVPFRDTDRRVLDVTALAGACSAGPAALARILLRLPVREVFIAKSSSGGGA